MNRIITEERLTTLLHKENMLSKIEIPDNVNPFEATVTEEELSQYEPVKIKINSVMKKLQKSRVDWQSKPRKKSGFNKFQNFKYFVLKDILPTVNEIFNKNGLYSQYNLTKDYAELIITDSSTGDYLTYRIPVQKLDNPTMQNIGAINTYSKRYLYMNALEIEEDEDELDSQDLDKPVNKESKEELIKKISEALGESKLNTWLKTSKKEKIEDFTVEELSKVWNSYSKNIKK
jgi:putative phage essential recombination function protein|nr:MAG TPA: ERF superfamily protein [Caudoviricetes sp.]